MILPVTFPTRSTCKWSRDSSPVFPPVFVVPRFAPDSNPPEPLPLSVQRPLCQSVGFAATAAACRWCASARLMPHTSLRLGSDFASTPDTWCSDACPARRQSPTSSTLTTSLPPSRTSPVDPVACISSPILSHLPLESKLSAYLLLIPLRGQEECRKQAGIPDRGR